MVNRAWIAQERDKAVQWARDVLRREFVIFDGETTGLDFDDEFVQVGAIDQNGEVLLDLLVKADKPIAADASAIHGLTAAHVINAPRFPDLYPQIAGVLAGRLVVAYNADFDSRILWQACGRYALPMIDPEDWHCAMKRYAQYHGHWDERRRSFRWVRLSDACAAEHVPALGAHSAVGDCLLTLRLIQKMAASAGEG